MTTYFINQFISTSLTNFSIDLSFLTFVPTNVQIKSITFCDTENNRTMYLTSDLINEAFLFPFTCRTDKICDYNYTINEYENPSFTVSILNSDNELVQYPANTGSLFSSLVVECVFSTNV